MWRLLALVAPAAALQAGPLAVASPSYVSASAPVPSIAMVATTSRASMPRVRRQARSGGKAVESWYYESFKTARLLTAEEEVFLARQVHAGEALEAKRTELEEELERSLTLEEWADAVELSPEDLRRKLARANRARDHMVASNMRLVVSVVRPYVAPNAQAGGALSMEDLVQEGSLGLMKAVSRFNEDRGLRFSTFATWWIRSSVQRAVADQARTIRLPNAKFRPLSQAKQANTELEQRLGRRPTERELCAELQTTLPQLRGVLRHWHAVGSLEAPARTSGLGGEGEKRSTLLDAHGARPLGKQMPLVEAVEIDMVRETLRRQLGDTLSPLENDVLRLRFGLDDGDCLSWKEIAQRCGTPVRELQTAQSRSFRRLKKKQVLHQLQHFCHHSGWDVHSPE